jgi:uncharacterized protein DUF4124
MKMLVSLVALTLVPAFAHAEEVWRWKDANGTLCYSNRTDAVPAGARPVETRIVVEAATLPGGEPDLEMSGGMVTEARERHLERRPPSRRLHRIYTERRLGFDCYASSVLYSGGWAHPDDVTVVGNCLPYLLGPEAWLNGARAELALRQQGLDWRRLVPMYLAEQEAERRRGD